MSNNYPANRTYDRDRPVRPLTPTQLAELRADRLEDPLDRARFLDAFAQGRVAAERGDTRLYLWFRAAMDTDRSATVAGLIEGAASVERNHRMVF